MTADGTALSYPSSYTSSSGSKVRFQAKPQERHAASVSTPRGAESASSRVRWT
jgi:hypothetical protein